MNFKEWEKVSEDNKTVTLKHPKGHQMTIALKGLPKIQQEQLKRLTFAKGGAVDDDVGISVQGRDVRSANEIKKWRESHPAKGPNDLQSDRPMHQAKEEARGRAAEERHVKPKLKGLSDGGRVNYDDGTPEAPISSDDPKGAAPAPQGAPTVVINTAAPAQGSPNPQAPAPTPAVSQAPATPVPPIKLAEPKQVNGSSLGNEANKSLQGVEDAKTAIQNQATVEGAKAQAMVPAAQEALESEQAIAKRVQGNRDMINNQTQQFNDFIAQHPIDPKHYQESQSAGAKVNTAIGLFVGGLGSAFGGTNYAFDHLEKQIDRDLHAQQQNVDNKKSVLGAWQNLYGANNISDNLAKASMNDIYAKKVQLAGLQAGTAQAQINAAQGVQKLQQDAENYRNNAAALSTKAGISGKPPGKAGPQAPAKPGASGNWGDDDEAPKKEDEHILVPGADKAAQLLLKNPLAAPQMAAIQEQKTKADLADKAIDTINAKFPLLAKSTGGAAGYLRRKGHLLGAIPYAGPMIESATDYATDSNTNASYDSNYQSIVGAVRGALQGNVSDDLLDSTVRKNTPETNDPPELKKEKINNLKQFVRDHTKTDLLRANGLSKR